MTLDELRAHSLFPFADFRENDASFLMLELYWAALAREALGEDFAARCQPLQAAERDAEDVTYWEPVMLDFWRPDLRRGARILLLENPEGLPYCRDVASKTDCAVSVDLYFQRRGVTGPEDEIDQIVLLADMSDLARTVTTGALRRFLIDGATPAEMEAEWDDFLTRTGEGPTNAQLAAQQGDDAD
ncbi:hypothetical protein [Jannaschia pohangensis]|uniref:Uncharacterized protein n=1 Tax=Jannaschia pohangensis TaxID=390807 RepID=A0A1I3SUL5_9RHOB|nr:hypothetical protein [Jannaschia pohangensis]SFJ61241.1 hypothetical protein SAMN04488095_3252 [Jannaschia pohangensis]